MNKSQMSRRKFLRLSAQTSGALSLGRLEDSNAGEPTKRCSSDPPAERFSGIYQGEQLSQIAFPMGGLGAGMICLEGTGGLAKFSLRNRPDLGNEPKVFAAVALKGSTILARVLEGPIPECKLRPNFPTGEWGEVPRHCWGLPRYRHATFKGRFPFGTVDLTDDKLVLDARLVGWSPFYPGDADNSSLPVCAIEYTFTCRGEDTIDAVFSFNAENFMTTQSMQATAGDESLSFGKIRPTSGGFVFADTSASGGFADVASFAVWTDDQAAKVNHAWFRGEGVDSIAMAWADITAAKCYEQGCPPDQDSPGASIFVPLSLNPGQSKTISIYLAWYVATSNLFEPKENYETESNTLFPRPASTYRPWYAGRFDAIDDLIEYWRTHHQQLRDASQKFSHTFYDSTLPPEVIDAVSANLSILKSPTILRQTDGRIWGWEGCNEAAGSCFGSSTHVWNYAQALAHLFPELERSLRETEFEQCQTASGFQTCRSALPIRPINNSFPLKDVFAEPADGQLGGIVKAYRDWRISGDTEWIRRMWPNIHSSINHCINTWDPQRKGWIDRPHGTTYDVVLWGPEPLCTSLYLGALNAAKLMGAALGENVEGYRSLLEKGVRRMEEELFNGEYFFQKFDPGEQKYQYGTGCLSDGVFGEWLCFVSGVPQVIDRTKVENHLTAVYRYNLRRDLNDHVNLMRSSFANGAEPGLLLCSWPREGRPVLPMYFAGEVWTGIEYQVASHLISLGKVNEGLEIVRLCRQRYEGRVRNPFDEVEAGHWYARAMSSYALLQALGGARFDAVDRTLYLTPTIEGDYRCFLCTASGFGTVGVKNGKPFVEVVSGGIPYERVAYRPAHLGASLEYIQRGTGWQSV